MHIPSRRKRTTRQLPYQALEPRKLLAGMPIISEFLASNGDGIVDDNGTQSDWIEIYNAGDAVVDLAGYTLTDDAGNPDRYEFPSINLGAGQFLVIRASTDAAPAEGSDLYTGFSLSADGEYVGLYDPAGVVVSEFGTGGADYPQQYTDISYGVLLSGGFDQLRYFGTPTPGASNTDSYAGVTDRVQANVAAGFFEESFQVSLSTSTPGASIGYTLDGSTPTLTNALFYSGPITVSSTSNLRAISIRSNYLSSPDRTWSYIFVDDVLNQSNNGSTPTGWPSSWGSNRVDYGIDPQVIAIEGSQAVKDALLSIPTWSITTDLDNLFDPTIGIYANPLQDGINWERPASVELLNPDGAEGFQVNAGLRIRGGFSRQPSNAKHSFRLFFRSEYGDSELEYPVHGGSGVDTFDRIDLRTAQNYSWSKDGDSSNNFIVDQFNRENQLALGQPSSRSSWLHLYLNGQYWGLFQTQERVDNNFAADYLGGDPDNYDVIKPDAGPNRPYTNEASEGNLEAYNRLFQQALARAADGITPAFQDNAAYYKAQGLNPDGTPNVSFETLLDVDNLIDYMTLIFHGGNFDAPITNFINPRNSRLNNYNAIRDRTGDHGFHFFVHDAEHSYRTDDIDRTGPYNHENLESGVEFFNPQWLHQQLMANAEYRVAFADRVQEVFFNGGALSDENLLNRYDSLATEIDQAIIAESARWGDARSSNPLLRSNWVNAVASIRNNILTQRSDVLLNQLRDAELRLDSGGNNYNIVVDAPLFPSVDAPSFLVDGTNQTGGLVDPGSQLQFSSNAPTVYYTLDGSDPREVGGAVSSEANASGLEIDTLIESGDVWKYNDTGANLVTAWRQTSFNDSAWSSGASELGYGDDDEETEVSFAGSSTNKNITTYFRKTFDLPAGAYSNASLRIKRDDGAVVYLNGQEIVRTNMPGGTINFNTPAASVVSGGGESAWLDFDFDPSLLSTGSNLLAVEVHQVSPNSSDITFDLELTVGKSSASPIVLNGLTTINARSRSSSGEWSPLQQASFFEEEAPQAAIRISEVNYNPYDPSTSEIAAGHADNDSFEFLELYNSSATGTVNLNGMQFDDGITYVFGSAELGPGERAVVVKDVNAFRFRYGTEVRILGEYTGSLSNGGERVRLIDSNFSEITSVEYDDTDPWSEVADGSGTTLVLLDPENTSADRLGKYYSWQSSVEQGGSPGEAGLSRLGIVINEVVSNPLANQLDSIELYNSSTAAINIGGWYLSDAASNPFKYRIPTGTTLGPGQYVVFDETDFNPTPASPQANHFGLSGSSGDEVYLTRGIGFAGAALGFEDAVSFGGSFNGESFGRDLNGSGRLARLNGTSLGSVNSNALVGPLVISEVNYHPGEPSSASLAIDSTLTDNDLEFIEIHNRSENAVVTTNWRIRGEVDFDFPAGSIAGGATWVLVSFDPAASSSRLNAFRTHYGIDAGVTVVGPFSDNGSFLSNSSGRISLQQPDEPVEGFIPHVVVDEVVYDDLSPWADADGNGSSLNRISGGVNGNFASTWNDTAPTPGVVDLASEVPQVTGVIRDGGSVARPDLWSTIAIQFNADVNLSVSALTLQNDTVGGAQVDLTGIVYSYDASTSTATWDLSNLNTALPASFYTIVLDSDSVTSSVGGGALDGDDNGSSGGDFTTEIYKAIPGDANLDGQVNVLGDGFVLVGNLGTTSGAAWADGDFNADGQVNVLGDGFALVGNLGSNVLPPASSMAAQFVNQSVAPVSQSSLQADSLQVPVLVNEISMVSGLSKELRHEIVPVSIASPALAGSQQLDEAFASEDWLI